MEQENGRRKNSKTSTTKITRLIERENETTRKRNGKKSGVRL